LQEEGDQKIVAALVAMSPREAVGQNAAGQIAAQILLDIVGYRIVIRIGLTPGS
jgi:hypothetical protein